MKKTLLTVFTVIFLVCICLAFRLNADTASGGKAKTPAWKCEEVNDPSAPVVYFTRDISPEGLVRAYKALGWKPQGKVGVKISTGESAKTRSQVSMCSGQSMPHRIMPKAFSSR